MAIKEDKLVTRLDLRRIIESKPSDYYVCEQPGEGSIPAHLAVVKDDAGDTRVALVTPLGAYSFPALELFGAFLPCGTLLECDLVYNLEWKRHVISVADILAYPTPLGSGAAAGAGGVPDSFEKRYKELDRRVMGAYGTQVKDRVLPVMPMVKRKWYSRERCLGEILPRLHKDSDLGAIGSVCYKEGPSRYHTCGGLVIIANRTGRQGRPTRFLFTFSANVRITAKVSLDSGAGRVPSWPIRVEVPLEVGKPGSYPLPLAMAVPIDVWDEWRIRGELQQALPTQPPTRKDTATGEGGGANLTPYTALNTALTLAPPPPSKFPAGDSKDARSGHCELLYRTETGTWGIRVVPEGGGPPASWDTVMETLGYLNQAITLGEMEVILRATSTEAAANEWTKKQACPVREIGKKEKRARG